ncbi:hypothetical protein WS68_14460 [Burkholderia sp. TSV86]|nr:hypothetical protein WS68_14460 [Burkholderia sp. TSV86]
MQVCADSPEAPACCDAPQTPSAFDAGSSHRRGRRRFGDAIPDMPPRTATGAIAISFAVVSRRHWPR